MNIMHRIHQYIVASKAEIHMKDVNFIRRFLTKKEQILFYRMSTTDQCHSLNVAYKLTKKLKDVETFQKEPLANKKEAIIAALLHDVGKTEAPFSLMARSLYVLTKTILKKGNLKFIYKLGQSPKASKLIRNFYVLEFHPQIGVDILKTLTNDSFVLDLVLKHQEPLDNNDPIILNLLKEADQEI